MVWNYAFPDATMYSLIQRRQQDSLTPRKLFRAVTGSQHFVQRLKLDRKLEVHDGCVNTVCWNEQGSLLLSGSDDQHLVISDPFNGKIVAKIRSGHRSNIFSAKFLPSSMDRELVSCSGSGEIFYTDVDREDTYGTNRFDCHFGTTYKIVVVPNEAATFLSCGDDGTVRFFDLRVKTSCTRFNCEEDVVINLRDAVSAMAVDPIIPFQMAVGSADGIVRIYDRRMLKMRESGGSSQSLISRFQSPSCASEKRHYRITSLNYRPGSHDVLVNYSSENIYLFNTYDIDATTQTFSTQPLSMGETSKTVNELNATRMSGGSTDEEPSTSGATAAASDNGHDVSGVYKPIKRLRLRGDWSDTGPDARPESEDPAPTNLIMQRMSDLLTRMLNSHGTGRLDEGENSASSSDQLSSDAASRERVPTTSQASSTTDSTTAAAMLRSVMLTSTGNGGRPSMARENTESQRYSISSEGLVSPELSSQDYDSTDLAATQHQAPARKKAEDLGSSSIGIDSSSSSAGAGQAVGSGTFKSDVSKHSACLREQYENELASQTGLEEAEVRNVSSVNPDFSTTSKTNNVQQGSSGSDNDRAGDITGDKGMQAGHTPLCEETDTRKQAGQDRTVIPTDNIISPPSGNNASPRKQTSSSQNLSESHNKSSQSTISSHEAIQLSTADTSYSTPYPDHTTCQTKNSMGFFEPLSTQGSHSAKSSTASCYSDLPDSDDVLPSEDAMRQRITQERAQMEQWALDEDHSLSGQLQSPLWHEPSCSKTAENSTNASLSQSSYSDVAIAEGNLSSCEGTFSQQTLDDVSMITSWGAISSFSERLSEAVTPEPHAKESMSLGPTKTSSPARCTQFHDEVKQESLQGQDENTLSSSVDIEAIETLYLEDRQDKDNSDSGRGQIHGSTPKSTEGHERQECSKGLRKGSDLQPVSEASETQSASQPKEEVSASAASDSTVSAPPIPSGKGKGIGKSSGGGKGKEASQQPTRIYAPYNSGNMKYSSDDERSDIHMSPEFSTECEHPVQPRSENDGVMDSVPSTQPVEAPSLTARPVADEPVGKLSVETESPSAGRVAEEANVVPPETTEHPGTSWLGAEQSGTRQRRAGYSLPPTGSFQLYTDEEDNNDDDDDAEERRRRRRENNDSDRMGRAASKIQELFRRKRQASEAAKLKELPQPRVLMKFAGHRNCRTMIKEANFYGDDYIMSGSDCGRILLWERLTGRLVMYLEADRHVVNCVQPNPVFPLIASSGIDYDIKVWAPLEEDSQFDEDVAEMIIHRNELMLVETRDTITVPAAFMLRVLASLSQIRTGRNSSGGQNQSGQEQSGHD